MLLGISRRLMFSVGTSQSLTVSVGTSRASSSAGAGDFISFDAVNDLLTLWVPM